MHKRNIGQPRLVRVKRIFFVFAVKGDKSFVVLTVFAALVPGIGAKVEHIPDVCCPKVLPCIKLLNQLFMIVSLIFLGVVALRRLRRMPVERFTAVFAAPDRNVRVGGVEFIKPRSVHRSVTAVPAEVMVIRHNVGYLNIRVVDVARRNAGDGRQSCLVQLVGKVVENSVIFE